MSDEELIDFLEDFVHIVWSMVPPAMDFEIESLISRLNTARTRIEAVRESL